MICRYYRCISFSLVLLFGVVGSLNAQNKGIKNTRGLDSLIIRTENHMYNLEFTETNKLINQLSLKLPGHPLPDLMHALNFTWKVMPNPKGQELDTIMSLLQRTIDKAERLMEKNEDDPEAKFFALVGHGLRAQNFNDQGSSFKALGEAKAAYNLVIDGMDLTEDYVEFNFTSGLYNYYREKYPEVYPVYKPLVWVFKRGDLELGLKQIKYSIEKAPFSAVEASHYLAYIYLRYEEKPEEAFKLLKPLTQQFPRNPYFKALYLESLYLLNRLEGNQEVFNSLIVNRKPFYKSCGKTYSGAYQETVLKNDLKAENEYKDGLMYAKDIGTMNDHLRSLSYLGLGRIMERKGDLDKAKSYFKQAEKTALQPEIKREAEAKLKSL